MTASQVHWTPRPDHTAVAKFIVALRERGVELPAPHDAGAFRALHRWSIEHPDAFWRAVWLDAQVLGTLGEGSASAPGGNFGPPVLAGPRWFPEARLNFAENLLRHAGTAPAIVSWDERGAIGEWSRDRLRAEVSRVAAGFRALGLQPGDRVAGWLPNIAEAVIAMLATASIGGVWTSCSPDFGVEGIVDRFGQTEPVLLLFADGYRYSGRDHDCLARARELLARLPTVRHAIRIKYLGDPAPLGEPRQLEWDALGAESVPSPLQFAQLPFDHPLYILYSSGTTGLPKCLVHGAGGTLLQHLKEHRLHGDLRNGERLFYFTTCGWMMWNWLVSGLATGATLVLYDGAPMPPAEPDLLWRLADEAGVHVFGTSAKYLALAEKSGLEPRQGRSLTNLRAILSTGSPLAPESFDWVAQAIGPVQVSSISGGTDIVSCFVLGNPLEPVYRGEIQGPGLGMAVDIFGPDGESLPDDVAGELVCTAPFPSMPIRFWNDPDGRTYHEAYFARFPGVWHHGDWAARTMHGGFIITGRSDATLNPGGVRIGTAEIYRQVEAIDEVVESLVIGQRVGSGATSDVRVVLFVRLRPDVTLDDPLRETIRRRIRSSASPHHVPKVILAVTDIPRTRSGKLSELAVRDTVEGREVKNVGALANPEALEEFRDRPELRDG
jgi:acetoacetyl-CoA synthetase